MSIKDNGRTHAHRYRRVSSRGVAEHRPSKPSSHPLYAPGPAFVTLVVISVLLFSYVGGKNDYPKLVVGVLFLLFLGNILLAGRRFNLPLEYKLVAAWLVIGSVGAIVAIDSNVAVAKLFTLVTVVPMSVAIFHFVLWYKSPRSVWAGVVIGALVMCYLSKNEQAIEAGNERLSATAGNPNELAYILVVSEIFVLHGFLAARTLLAKALMAALAVVIVYFIPLTGSRQGLLGLILIILIYASLKLEFKNIGSSIRSVLVAGLFTLALAGSIIYAQRTTYFDRFTDFLESVQTGRIDQKGRTGASIRNRYLFYKYGLDIAAHNPAFGVGLDNFKLAIAEYPGFGGHASYAHSNYVEVLADTGVPGFILYFSMYVAIGKRLFRLRGRVKERSGVQLYHTLIVLLGTTLITDFSMVSYYDKIAWIVLSSVIAATLVLERKLANVPSMLHTGKRNAAA